MQDLARLRWRCRRGTKELDLLLGTFLEQHGPRLTAEQRADFDHLLEQPDDLLQSWLLYGDPVPLPRLVPLVQTIREAHTP